MGLDAMILGYSPWDYKESDTTEWLSTHILDLSTDYLSDQEHIPGAWNTGYSFRLMEWDVYWKQDGGLRVSLVSLTA